MCLKIENVQELKHRGIKGCVPYWLRPIYLQITLPLGLSVLEIEQGTPYPEFHLPPLLISPHNTNPGHAVDSQKIATFCQKLVHLKEWNKSPSRKRTRTNDRRDIAIIKHLIFLNLHFVISVVRVIHQNFIYVKYGVITTLSCCLTFWIQVSVFDILMKHQIRILLV